MNKGLLLNSTTDSKKIVIIILQWNNSADTIACLESILQIDYPHFEVILVDNGSRPEEIAAVRSAFKELICIENGKNLGFAEGNNIGIQEALKRQAEYLLLLNNDTIVDKHILTAFVSAAENNRDAGVLGAKIYYFDEPTTLWYAGGNVNLQSFRCYHEGCTESDLNKRHETVRETNYACGCALFITREAVEKVGMMDPRFFLIWEEIDWCWRIRKAGYRCLFVPQARVWHKISQSFEGGNRGPSWQYYYFRNRLLFIQKHIPIKKRLAFYATTFLKEIGQMLWLSIHPQTPAATRRLNRSALKGVRDYLLGRCLNQNNDKNDIMI